MANEHSIWAYVLAHPEIPIAAVRATKILPTQQAWSDALSFARLCFHDYLTTVKLPTRISAKQARRLNSQAINRIKNRLTNELTHLWHQVDVAKQAIQDPSMAESYQEVVAPDFAAQTEQLDEWQQFIREAGLSPRQQTVLALRDLDYTPTAIARELGISRPTVYKEITFLQTAYLAFAPRHGLRLPKQAPGQR